MLGTSNLAAGLSTGSVGMVFVCFLAGMASSFTPCIYPLIPVTIGILGSREAGSNLKAFLLTMSYVIGIATTYAVLGLVAALTGSLFGSLSSNPWVLLGVAVVIMALALNMLETFNINFGRFSLGTGTTKNRGMISNFGYGLTFGLVASPCTAPPLAVILTWVGSTHNLILGPIFLFSFALGMGSILVLIGTFSSFLYRLPRSGGWMIVIKKVMGYMMVIMAGYFVFQAGRQW